MRMYLRWAERHGYPTEVYDISYAEEAGIKSATFAVKAPYAYGTLSVEAGPTGWCGSRRSTTRAGGRRRSRRSRWCR
jgi:protein subunit release factor B